MIVRIRNKPVLIAKINIIGIRDNLRRYVSLKNSIKSNIMITYNDMRDDLDNVLDFIFYGLEWGRILQEITTTQREFFTIQILEAEYDDYMKVNPGIMTATPDGRELVFDTNKCSGKAFFILQDMFHSYDFNIDNFLRINTYENKNDWVKK